MTNPRQLASVVYCLRKIRLWSAIDRIEKLETRVEGMKKIAELTHVEAESVSDGITLNEFTLGVAALSYEIGAFRSAINQAQQ